MIFHRFFNYIRSPFSATTYATCLLLFAAASPLISINASAERLVILHTNDTHSYIDVNDDGLGGVQRRKAFVDSVRRVEPNVLLVDAGDVVQGTLYFTLYRGEVENKVMTALGYDLAILGNHEFDNGMEELARNLNLNSATYITTNYVTEGTPLDGHFVPYVIKEYGGKRIAFMGINLHPKGMISSRNVKGLGVLDIYEAANSTAWALRHNEKADMVVALTHIGYGDKVLPCDTTLAKISKNIDLIIGGHTHTPLNPADSTSLPTRFKNAEGRDVLIAQLRNTGGTIGQIDIDLDNLSIKSQVCPLDERYDSRHDATLEAIIAPYRHKVDSLMSIKVAKAKADLSKQSLVNIFSDLTLKSSRNLTNEAVDLAIVNNGGVRRSLPAGDIMEGHIIMTIPFENYIEVVQLKGNTLIEIFNQMVAQGINGVSANVSITYDAATDTCTNIIINGKPIDPDRTYNVATIDYLAEGGDHLDSFPEGTVLAISDRPFRDDIIAALKSTRKALSPTPQKRITPSGN